MWLVFEKPDLIRKQPTRIAITIAISISLQEAPKAIIKICILW